MSDVQATPGPLPRGFRIVLWVVLPVFLLSVGTLIGYTISRGVGPGAAAPEYDPLKPDFGLEATRIPPFSLVDQEGKPTGIDVFAGRITVVGFVFTNCPLACPVMTSQMANLQRILTSVPVRFASISIDPAHDTPARLKEFAASYGADLSRWIFLTQPNAGTPEAGRDPVSWKILGEHLHHHIAADTTTSIPLKDGSEMQSIQHPPHLFLVGPGGQVLGMYDSKNAGDMRALEDRARRAGIALTVKNQGPR